MEVLDRFGMETQLRDNGDGTFDIMVFTGAAGLKFWALQYKYEMEQAEITAIYHENKGRYGYRRITIELDRRGIHLNHKTLTAKTETVNPKLTALNVELAQVEDEIEKLLNTLTGASAVLIS